MSETDTVPQETNIPQHEVIAEGVLGLQAVLQEERRVAAFLKSDHMPESADVHDSLDNLRTQISALPKTLVPGFSSIMQENAPRFLQSQFDVWKSNEYTATYKTIVNKRTQPGANSIYDTPDITWFGWLANGASNEQLLNFVQWHTHRIEAMQKDPETKQLIEKAKLGFKYGVKNGIKAGFLDPESAMFLDQLDDMPIIITDLIDASEGGDYALGYAIVGTNSSGKKQAYITEPLGDAKLVDEFYETTAHELGHLYGNFGPDWANEALTEHLAQAVLFGQWETIDPPKRGMDKNVYGPYRGLMAAVVGDGQSEQSINLIKSLMRCYSGHTPEARTKAYTTTKQYFIEMYGTDDVFEALTLQIQREIEYEKSKGSTLSVHDIGMGAAATLIEEWKDPATRAEIIEAYEGHVAYSEAQLKDSLDEAYI